MQKKLSLKFIHIFVSSLLVIMALFFIGTQKPYIKEIEAAELDHPAFSFLQEGQYILDIIYENGTGNRIIVYSKAISAPESDMAYTELAEYEITEETDSNEYCNCIFELLCSACNHRIREISLANECFVYVCHIPAYKSILQSRIGGKPCYGVSSLATVGHL